MLVAIIRYLSSGNSETGDENQCSMPLLLKNKNPIVSEGVPNLII